MNKFSIALLSIICCAQQIQSMENEEISIVDKDKYCEMLRKTGNFTVKNYDGNLIYVAYSDSHGSSAYAPNKPNFLNLELYNHNLNETDIENLIHQGANVNHEDNGFDEVHGSLAAYHAKNKSEQGIKNMAQLIKHGINLHKGRNNKMPLYIAVINDNTDMTKLLLSPTLLPDKKVSSTQSTLQSLLDTIKEYAFIRDNVEVIGSLLTLRLITPSHILKRLATRTNPNKDILNLLVQHDPHNDDNLSQMMHAAFPGIKKDGGTHYIDTLKKMCEDQDVSSAVYSHIQAIKKDIDAIMSSLETKQQNNLS